MNGAVTAAFEFSFNELARGIGGESPGQKALNKTLTRAEEIACRDSDADGTIRISIPEMLEVFEYEYAKLSARKNRVGDYKWLDDFSFTIEAYNYGDSLFFRREWRSE